jgi:hypothetical protein
MSDKKLALLGIIAVLMAAAAILQHRIGRGTETAGFESAPLIEGLNIDAIAAIEISGGQGSQTVKLIRENDRFTVSNKNNYPADAAKINNLINQCLDIRAVEKITSDPRNHPDLQVSEDTARYVIAFLNSEQQPIVTLVLSPSDSETNTAYARLLSENDVYSIQSSPWFNTRPIDYIDTELVSVSRDAINSVAVKTSESSYVLTSPEGSAAIQLEKMPAGKQFQETAHQTVFNALSSLRFEDVSRPAGLEADLTFDQTYNCKLYDLTVYKLEIAKNEDKTYVKVSADFLDKTPVEKTMGQVETDEELKKKEAKLLAIDKVKDFNAAHKGWIYQIPSYKADQLTKPLSELIEDIPAPAESNDTEATDNTAGEEQ